MTTREDYERRFLAASEARGLVGLAREVAAALSEVAHGWNGFDRASDEPAYVVDVAKELGAHLPQPATPQAPAPTGEVMSNMLAVQRLAHAPNSTFEMMPDWNGPYLHRGAAITAALADQREAVEAACAPLRDRIERLTEELRRWKEGEEWIGGQDYLNRTASEVVAIQKERITELEAALAGVKE